jgi:tetratricopeptide (TPR) repeat protein
MPDQMPPARRRPGSGTGPSVGRPASRRSTGERALPAAPAPGGTEAALLCSAGPKAGTEFPLSGDEEIVIGRANENVISIPDTSVSRRHCSVRKVDDGWAVSDLGSGNGTLVNGERIEGETVLRNSDTITIGDTELTFQDVANSTAPRALPVRRTGADVPARRSSAGRPDVRARLSRSGAPAADPAKKRKVMLIGGAVAVVVLGGLVAAKVVVDRQNEALVAQQQQEAARRGELASVFQEGKNLVRDGKWTDARVKFEEILARSPNYPGVKDYLDRANEEIPNQQHLADADQALNENKLGAAAAALKSVSSTTQQFEKLRAVKSRLDQKLTERLREATGLMNAVGDKAVRREAYVRAREITADILLVNADHRDAQVVNQSATRQIELLDAPPVVVTGPAPKPWEAVIARYLDGDLTGALAMADACGKERRCANLASEMREFANLYKKVEDLDVRGLQRIIQLDRAIGDGKRSKMGAVAGTRAATAFYRNASSAKVAGQWGKAMEWAKKALQADPGHAPSQAIVQEVTGKARDVYMLGYQLEPTSPDDAAVRYREVLVMTSPGDEFYDKAKSRLTRLER